MICAIVVLYSYYLPSSLPSVVLVTPARSFPSTSVFLIILPTLFYLLFSIIYVLQFVH